MALGLDFRFVSFNKTSVLEAVQGPGTRKDLGPLVEDLQSISIHPGDLLIVGFRDSERLAYRVCSGILWKCRFCR